MGTKTISLADDAYEKLTAHKREGESFSDVVRRLTSGVTLADYHGILGPDAADGLERLVEDRRQERSTAHRERVEDVVDALKE